MIDQDVYWGECMPKTTVLGIRYENGTIEEAANDVLRMAGVDGAKIVVTPNPEISECCIGNPRLRQAVAEADYVVPDGIGVIMAAKICGTPLKERVGGYDLACALLPLAARENKTFYFLGAKPGIAEKAIDNIRHKYPQIQIVGVHDGYFQNDDEVINEINRLCPDILFVALGSPRQEIWMHDHRRKIKARVMMGLGGSLDVFAGVAKRAPKIFIRLNLEWFYRLLCQPTRFVRMLKLPRYLIRAIAFRLFHRSKENKEKSV
jgi:N-acetylglucosaminyldiphosphoundecaprenol N-acetyl-beta-D-mannosaminyltransferase